MEELLLFIMCFIFIFFIYQLFIVRPAKNRKKNNKRKKDKDKELLEIKYLEIMYKIDLKKIKYEQLLQICALTSSLDISIVVFLMTRFDNYLLEIVVGFISIFILILVTYHFVYLFYKKKGMIIDGKH